MEGGMEEGMGGREGDSHLGQELGQVYVHQSFQQHHALVLARKLYLQVACRALCGMNNHSFLVHAMLLAV